MYVKSTITKGRSSRWADRRRYYRRLFEQARPKSRDDEAAPEVAPVSEKD